MPRRDNFSKDWIARLEMQIRTNEFNIEREGTVSGFNQLASATERLRYQLDSWKNNPPSKRKVPPLKPAKPTAPPAKIQPAKSNRATPKGGPVSKP
jgi:hypothetical protein